MPLLAVFALALAARLLFVFGADEPLLYAHQYTYFTNALRIAEHPHALAYVLRSDEWRTWDQHWTIAPLYHLFAALVFRVFGPHLVTLRVIQCALDAGVAVAVAALGRAAAGRRGVWAGAVYALYWPAVEMRWKARRQRRCAGRRAASSLASPPWRARSPAGSSGWSRSGLFSARGRGRGTRRWWCWPRGRWRSSSAQKRREWSITARWHASCQTT